MKYFFVKGFPTQVSRKIEIPPIAELFQMPFFTRANPEAVYRYGTSFQKYLLDQVPIQNPKKNIQVTFTIQYLNPKIRGSLVRDKDFRFENEWHVDGTTLFGDKDAVHLLVSPCTALTQFNTNPMKISMDGIPNKEEFARKLREEDWGLIPQTIEPNKIITFTDHVHRSATPQQEEFRLFFRVIECSERKANEGEKALTNLSTIIDPRRPVDDRIAKSICKEPNAIKIYFND